MYNDQNSSLGTSTIVLMGENQIDARRGIQWINHRWRRVVITMGMRGLPIIIVRWIPVSLILFIMPLCFVLSVIAIVPVLIAVSLMVAVVIGKGWRHCHGTEH